MPLTAAQTEAQLDDTSRNPTQTAGHPVNVHVDLKFVGVAFDPSDLYDALNAQWGTVASDKDTMQRGTYQFTITA